MSTKTTSCSYGLKHRKNDLHNQILYTLQLLLVKCSILSIVYLMNVNKSSRKHANGKYLTSSPMGCFAPGGIRLLEPILEVSYDNVEKIRS